MYALNNPYNNNIKQTSIFNIRKRTKMAYLGYKNTYKNITINKYFACNNIKKEHKKHYCRVSRLQLVDFDIIKKSNI